MTQVKRIALPKVRTAKIKILKGVCIAPGEDAARGDIYEVPKHVASALVANRQAEYTDEGDPSEGDDPGAAAHNEGYSTVTIEQPTNRDPKPKKKG